MKKIILLYNLNRGQYDYEAEFDSEITINAIERVLSKRYKVIKIEASRVISSWINKIIKINPDLIFNITEGYSGAAREAVPPAIFEQLNMKYSGPDPTNLLICLNKHLTKTILSSVVPTPDSIVINTLDFDHDELKQVAFPVIIKPNAEGSSLGILSSSVAHDHTSLISIINELQSNKYYNVLIEHFIEGIDVSMAYVEGLGVSGPSKIEYPETIIYDWELKTVKDKNVSIHYFDKASDNLKDILHLYSRLIVERLDLKGYAKIDFRIDKNSKIYFLEVNSQVSFHPDGEFAVAMREIITKYDDIILYIVKNALNSTRIPSLGYQNNRISDKKLAHITKSVYNKGEYGN